MSKLNTYKGACDEFKRYLYELTSRLFRPQSERSMFFNESINYYRRRTRLALSTAFKFWFKSLDSTLPGEELIKLNTIRGEKGDYNLELSFPFEPDANSSVPFIILLNNPIRIKVQDFIDEILIGLPQVEYVRCHQPYLKEGRLHFKYKVLTVRP